jgi:hypothetical protein
MVTFNKMPAVIVFLGKHHFKTTIQAAWNFCKHAYFFTNVIFIPAKFNGLKLIYQVPFFNKCFNKEAAYFVANFARFTSIIQKISGILNVFMKRLEKKSWGLK